MNEQRQKAINAKLLLLLKPFVVSRLTVTVVPDTIQLYASLTLERSLRLALNKCTKLQATITEQCTFPGLDEKTLS